MGTLPEVECAADRGKASPCCGQSSDDFDGGPVPASYQCPANQPMCLGYVTGSHLGKCETVNKVAAAVSTKTVAAASGQLLTNTSSTAGTTPAASTTSTTTTAAAAALGASLHSAARSATASQPPSDLKIEVESHQEPIKITDPAPDKVDTAFGDTGMLSVSSATPMFKAGFTRGGLTPAGLQFVNGKGDRIACASTAGAALTQNSNNNLKGFRGVEMTCAPAAAPSSSSTSVKMDGARSLRFRRAAEPTDLAKSLSQPHGAPFHGGSWLPFNPSVGLVAWPNGNPAAYRLAYEGVFGCMSPATVGPFGASVCPPGALVGPFALQTPSGTPFFMPFPGVPVPAGGAAGTAEA